MLGLGWTEMLVIGVVALIFIGPKDLPVVMGRIGKVLGQIRRMGNEFQREINRTTGLDEVRNLRDSISSPLKKTADEIRREFNTMTPTGQKPSGALKPTDPKVESVVDDIRSKAGMNAGQPESNGQAAAQPAPAAGKPVAAKKPRAPKPAVPKPAAVKPAAKTATAGRKAPKSPAGASTEKSAAAAAGGGPVKAARRSPAGTRAAKPAEATPAKPARKPRAKPAATETAAAPSAKKPRASRKKPAETAGKS
jgi:sec-independent protein translocase protein TatB